MTTKSKKPIKVSRDGTTLVAAFRNSSPPLIWNFDLERNHSFALTLQGNDNNWELGVLSARDEFHPVARFLSRDDAEEAFIRTQKALLEKKRNIWRPVSFTLAGVIVLLLVIVVSLMHAVSRAGMMKTAESLAPSMTSSRSSPFDQPPMQLKDGVPMSADQVLKAPP